MRRVPSAARGRCQCVRLDGGLAKDDDSACTNSEHRGDFDMASRARPALWRETVKAGAARSGQLIAALALYAAALLMAIALASYHSGDPSFNTASGGPALNWLGLPGAWFADIAFMAFGLPVALLLPILAIVATRVWRGVPVGRWQLMLVLAALGAGLMATTFTLLSSGAVNALSAGWGGLVGFAGSGALHALIDLNGNPVADRWTARGVALLTGLGGVANWAWSVP